ncbi:MAG: hypothetical protein JWN44_2979 [Myxococcales bacterium]|nr:hypothetical protein [Myxococcales bacterium]
MVWFGLNPNQPARASSCRALLRFDASPELWDARFDFSGGHAHPGRMVYTRVWLPAYVSRVRANDSDQLLSGRYCESVEGQAGITTASFFRTTLANSTSTVPSAFWRRQ